MNKRKYVPTIVLRQPDAEGGYWYATGIASSDGARVVHNFRVTQEVKRFSSKEDAIQFLKSNRLPSMNPYEGWEIYVKYNRAPVIPARKRLSERYCQDKRIVAGCFTTLISRATQAGYTGIAIDLQKMHTLLSNRLSADYERAKKGLEENGK
jgi:hypothetical protein